MRTTLTIDDDVLATAKSLAERQHTSVGQVISSLARAALRRDAPEGGVRNGVLLLAQQPDAVPVPVTLEQVNQLRDDLA